MKRILYVHHTSGVGGGSFCLLNIIKVLEREKCQPSVVLKDEGPLVGELEKIGVKVYFFPQMQVIPYNQSIFKLRNAKTYYGFRKSVVKFKELLDTIDTDIVYLNNMMLYPYLKAIKLSGKTSMIHIREHWPLDEHKMQLGWADDTISKYADSVVAINRYSASMLAKSKNKTTIVYDWIDMESRDVSYTFDGIFNEDTSRLKVLLFTGGFSKIKGALEVVKGFSTVVKDSQYRLIVLGGIPDDLKRYGLKHKIKLLLSKIGYSYYNQEILNIIQSDNRIKCVPAVYEITDIMRQSYAYLSFFVIPHANLAMAESMICELPCIAAKTDESDEYSLNGKLAHLYQFNNQKEFCNALKCIDSIHDELKSKLKAEKGAVKSMFDREINVAKLNNLYS